MLKEGEISKRGRVIESLPNTHFKVSYTDGAEGLVYLGGKMKINKIRVLVGDMVDVILDSRGGKGRIVKRG